MSEHPLSSPWTLMYLPAIDKQQTTTYGSYDLAYNALLNKVGVLKTVEAVCSTFNSIPKIGIFTPKDLIILSRDERPPKYEAFPNGSRKVIVDTYSDEASKVVLDLLLAAVLGDVLLNELGENPCHVFRVSHRPSMKNKEAARFEIWMDKPADEKAVKGFFDEMLVGYSVVESALAA
eukprot:GILJ01025077.1.p1 GENE.GILJ01025077.1~~GILJ01025077.1.p1  ORF type:complete len:177 (-),score=25.83 GILJ01025077.1:107-637(-)